MLVALPLDDRQGSYPAAPDLARFLERYREWHGAKFWELTA
jgi:hypothetical protein